MNGDCVESSVACERGKLANSLETTLKFVGSDHVDNRVQSAVDDNHHNNGRLNFVGNSTGTNCCCD